VADTTFDPWRAEPGTVVGFTDAEGNQREIRADDGGLLLAKDAEEEAALATFGFGRARVTAADRERNTTTVRKLTADETKE
jgi:hypothetical protein